MNKITVEHLSRSAYIYVRQSTPDQLTNNPESRRRQYALAARARALGWENVIVIDDDLGRSARGGAPPTVDRHLHRHDRRRVRDRSLAFGSQWP
jgi:DNA invertase Pin-like site-specific DNA recombinase